MPPRFLRSGRLPPRSGPTFALPPTPSAMLASDFSLPAQNSLELPNESYEDLYQDIVDQSALVPMDIDPPFDATALGLKEIGNLASWTVSSCKPGCGVEALRDDDIGQFWQYVLYPQLERPVANVPGADQMAPSLTT